MTASQPPSADPRVSPAPDAASNGRRWPVSSAQLSRHGVWFLVSFALLSVFPYYGRLNNPNENVRVWAVKAIVDLHELRINRVSELWGYVNDKAVKDGRLYSSKAPGASFVGVPIYFLQRTLARLVGIQEVSKRSMTLALRLFGVGLPLSVFLFFFARHVEKLTASATARDLLVAGLGLGTMIFPYGVIFVGHAVAAALAFSGFMLLGEDASGPRRSRLAWAGALVSLAVVFEYQVMFAAVALAAYALARHRRNAVYFLLGALPPAVLLGVYHTVLFGRPWEFPLGHIENPAWALLHNNHHFFGLSVPRPMAIATVLFAPDYGLFVFSPFLAIGLLGAGLALFRGDRAEGAVILAVTALMVAFLGGAPTPHPGWCVGPRYIAVVAPFLTAGVAYLWRNTRRPFALSVVAAGLILPSIVLNLVSGAIYPHYPESFDNPVFDLTFPLLGAGYVPYSLGWWLGLRGLWSLVPLGLTALAAVSLACVGDDRQSRRWATRTVLGAAVGAVYLLALGSYGHKPRAGEAQATALVRSTWEPSPAIRR